LLKVIDKSPNVPRPGSLMPNQEDCAKGGRALTSAKLAALAVARSKRKQATDPLMPPDGWRSAEHLLDDTREYLSRWKLTVELADYLGVDEKSVRRWVKREKLPRQDTLNAIAQWRRVKAAGL
jgi:hypothetical protein